MTSNMTEREAALAARVKELEAAQASSVGGRGGAFSFVGSVFKIVPRWLVIAAALVFIAWVGADLYLKIQQGQTLETLNGPKKLPPIKFSDP